MTTEEINRYRGCLLGLASGDAELVSIVVEIASRWPRSLSEYP